MSVTSDTSEFDQFIHCIGSESARFKESQYTLVYMSISLTCIAWQILTACGLLWASHKWLHVAVLVNVSLPFFVVMTSLLSPLFSVNCEVRYWVAIVCVNLGGACLQSILLYKAYICHNRSKWMLALGSAINIGYLALIFLYATLARVESHPDFIGNCVMNNLEWPALAKLGLDIVSNVFLSFAFLSVIRRHYNMFGNSLHKSLFSSGLIFSVGVIASNILTAILVSCRVVGGLSADLYACDWVITGYLLLKQFTRDHKAKDTEVEEEKVRTAPVIARRSTSSSILSCNVSDFHHHHDMSSPPSPTAASPDTYCTLPRTRGQRAFN